MLQYDKKKSGLTVWCMTSVFIVLFISDGYNIAPYKTTKDLVTTWSRRATFCNTDRLGIDAIIDDIIFDMRYFACKNIIIKICYSYKRRRNITKKIFVIYILRYILSVRQVRIVKNIQCTFVNTFPLANCFYSTYDSRN